MTSVKSTPFTVHKREQRV